MQPLLIVSVILGLAPDAGIGADEFARLLEPLHSVIRDVSFICEGASEFVGPSELLNGGNQDRSFQCEFWYRNDGSTRIEVYLKPSVVDAPFVRSTKALHQGRVEELTVNPDTRDLGKVRVLRGTGGSIRETGSPNYILYLWFFESLKDPSDRNYEYRGWEVVDGHRCLCVQFDFVPGLKMKDPPKIRFWMDLARGGHPLRVETDMGGKLASRVSGIKLDRFELSRGGQAWLPVDGVLEYFAWGPKTFDSPTMRETYHVLKGTVRINTDLRDEVFSAVKWKGRIPPTPGWNRMRQEFDYAATNRIREPRDPDSVKKRLDEKLREADLQSEMIEASSVARETWSWTAILQLCTAVVGISTLAAAVVWRRKSR